MTGCVLLGAQRSLWSLAAWCGGPLTGNEDAEEVVPWEAASGQRTAGLDWLSAE